MKRAEHELVAAGVDTWDWGPTEDDEEAVLAELYGPPDADGIYRGGGDQS
ncbi:hypothetical protein [Acrocarpospora sp. B8E8]